MLFMAEFPKKGWTKSKLLLKFRKYCTVDSSGRQRTARTDENWGRWMIESLVLNRDNMNGTSN